MDMITAIMVTRNDSSRIHLARESTIAFLNQHYPSKELLIVLDHDSPDFSISDSSIRVVRGKEGDKLGDLRNIGIEEANGSIVFQWDDDDWHREDAMDFQYKEMSFKNLEACCLKNQVRYSFTGNNGYIARCQVGHAGTIMHRKDTKYRYPPAEKSEDAEFWKKFWNDERHGMIDNDPCIYFRFHHGANTWHEGHIMAGLAGKKDQYDLPPDVVAYMRTLLTRYPH